MITAIGDGLFLGVVLIREPVTTTSVAVELVASGATGLVGGCAVCCVAPHAGLARLPDCAGALLGCWPCAAGGRSEAFATKRQTRAQRRRREQRLCKLSFEYPRQTSLESPSLRLNVAKVKFLSRCVTPGGRISPNVVRLRNSSARTARLPGRNSPAPQRPFSRVTGARSRPLRAAGPRAGSPSSARASGSCDIRGRGHQPGGAVGPGFEQPRDGGEGLAEVSNGFTRAAPLMPASALARSTVAGSRPGSRPGRATWPGRLGPDMALGDVAHLGDGHLAALGHTGDEAIVDPVHPGPEGGGSATDSSPPASSRVGRHSRRPPSGRAGRRRTWRAPGRWRACRRKPRSNRSASTARRRSRWRPKKSSSRSRLLHSPMLDQPHRLARRPRRSRTAERGPSEAVSEPPGELRRKTMAGPSLAPAEGLGEVIGVDHCAAAAQRTAVTGRAGDDVALRLDQRWWASRRMKPEWPWRVGRNR